MTKTRHIRRKHKGGSFASATRRIWWSRKIGINQDKKKEWMEGYNSKKAELKEFADTFIADFDEEDFANGVCSNLYKPEVAWFKYSEIRPPNYYFIKGHNRNKTYTFEEAKLQLDPKISTQSPSINHLGEVDEQMAERNRRFNEQMANPEIDFTNKSPIPIEDQQTFAKESLKKDPNFGSSIYDNTIGKKSKRGEMVGGRGWFGLGKGFGKGFQHHMYYSKIKPDSDEKINWKNKYNDTKKHLAKMRKKYFDLTEEKYAAGLYPKNIKSICTDFTPNPPNYYYIEGWKGDKVLGENLTYLEAKQRIDGMNADIKRKQNEKQHHKTQKTQQPNLNGSNFREVSWSSAGPSPQHSSNISNEEEEDAIHVG